MKTRIIPFVLLFTTLSGCVSISKYNAVLESNQKQRTNIEKLNKKAKQLEERNKMLADSLALYTGTASTKKSVTKKSVTVKTLTIIKKEDGIELSKDTFQNDEEKRILYFMNYARVKPQEFLKKYVLPNLRDTNSYYQKTLIETLRKKVPVEALKANEKMYSLAFCHARVSGLSGYVGHSRKGTCGIKGGYSAECCAYGRASYSSDPALNYVLQLLVDENVPSLGHREIILMGYLKSAGVSIQPHKTYGENVVIDFSAGI